MILNQTKNLEEHENASNGCDTPEYCAHEFHCVIVAIKPNFYLAFFIIH